MTATSFRLAWPALFGAGLLNLFALPAFAQPLVTLDPLSVEPLGQSSRRTSFVISEIMYNPLDRADGKNLEFVEIHNSLATPEDLSGYRLDGDADYTFPANTVLPPGGFLVVATSPADIEAVYGITGVLGPFSNTNNLPNTRGTIRLRHRTGAVFLEARYDTDPPWPAAADGAGHSLVLARPSYGEGNLQAWAASARVGGSPGGPEPAVTDPLRHVVINEFLAHTDEPQLDFIELYNHSTQSADLSGCTLSDARNTNKFRIPAGTILDPRGFVSFNQNDLGFSLNSGGESIYLRNAANTRVLDAVRFRPQANGVSLGRYPDGALTFSELATNTPRAANSPLLLRPIVINEIMYNPVTLNSDEEYIELYNRSTAAVNIGGWRLEDGIRFDFPAGASIPAGGYLVIARNAAHLIPRYPNLNSGNTLGDFGGGLANGGERIALAMPDPVVTTNNNLLITNYNYVVVDEVTYGTGGRWSQWSDGGGSSLELIDARGDNRLAANWADSDETAKAPWTTVSVAGVLDNGTSPADQLQVLLLGPGECLIDDVEVRTLAGANLVTNSTFEAGATNWTAEGTQDRSGLESGEGYQSTQSYRVRATDRGDNQVNRIRTPLRPTPSANATNTIRAKVRWLRGHPEILFRLRGNWLEADVIMDLPTNLGTPGARNSRALNNAPPAIYAVTHNPPVPAANEPVVVTARVHDPDGVASVQVDYRLEPNPNTLSVPMRDDGTAPDTVAGDGLYSGAIPGQASNVVAVFTVRATDGFTPAAIATFPQPSPGRECVVRFGETVPRGTFPSYRLWLTQTSFNTWDARHNLHNGLNDFTFVLGNHRVIYNAGGAYAGSPYIGPSFTTPAGVRCGYSIEMPADDLFLGDSTLVLDWPGGHGNENTAIQEQMAYWIADQMGVAFSHRYFIRLSVNGVTDMQRGGVFEAVMQPGRDFIRQWSPSDTAGDFYKIDRAFEFSDAGGLIADPEPQLRVYNTPDLVNGGIKKKAEKYRWYWIPRSFDRANNFTNLFVLADALNALGPEPYTAQTEGLVDIEQWMGIFAVEHIINNFDSWGHDIGKNMYMFKPENGRWQIYMFDLDWLMLVAAGSYPPQSGPLFIADDPTVTRMYNHPPFRRAYFRAVQDAFNNAFVTSKYEPVMDAKYNALRTNGVTMCDGQNLAAPTAVKTWFSQRRTFLSNQLRGASAPFTLNANTSLFAESNVVILSGTAPIAVKFIEVNGGAWPVTWTSVSNWTLRLPVRPGTNELTAIGKDPRGGVVAESSNRVTVVYEGPAPAAPTAVVINEIAYHPRVPDAEFVEVYNSDTRTFFDLSGWRINGLDYTFPAGTLLAPRGFLVLVKDRVAASVAYGTNFAAFDVYRGNLQADGETLTLLRPGGSGAAEIVVDKVRYENTAPWPQTANGLGPSLHLIDAAQDNSRAANWSDNPGWVFVSRTGNILNATNLVLWISGVGNAYVDDISLVGPDGTNIALNGGFESDLTPSWEIPTNYATSLIVEGVGHSGRRSLFLNGTSPGGALNVSVLQSLGERVLTNTNYTLSFWCLANTNQITVNLRTVPGQNLVLAATTTRMLASPGAMNAAVSTLPPFPPLWINEVQTENTTGIMDRTGRRAPWIELHNSGPTPIALDGFRLANNYTNLTQWAFPAGAIIAPGEFRIVFVDGREDLSIPTEWHTSFALSPGSGAIALSRLLNGLPQVVDHINYRNVSAGQSFGSFPDGQSVDRRAFVFVTPGAANNGAAAPLRVFINEWMASNTRTIADPATVTGQFDDWFEIYNPGTNVADLSGYFLTDNLTNRFQYEIPAGYTIPPRGYLLVWADGETSQNSSNVVDLHVNFQLGRTGESIGLFAVDGTQIDAISFGVQTNDVSEGRTPDGAAAIVPMTTPTPRAANVLAGNNTPPTLASIGRQVVHRGQTVSFTARATDSDLPAQTLTYTLDAGAPAGATIGAATGLFTWPTTTVLSPSTNTVVVRVTDNGVPPLSDSEVVSIVVLNPPAFRILSRAGNQLTLGWSALPGRTYRVEYTDNLGSGAWQALGVDPVGADGQLTVQVTLSSPAQRFFRIVVTE